MDSYRPGSRRGGFDPTRPSFQPNSTPYQQRPQQAYTDPDFVLPFNQQFYWSENGSLYMANTEYYPAGPSSSNVSDVVQNDSFRTFRHEPTQETVQYPPGTIDPEVLAMPMPISAHNTLSHGGSFNYGSSNMGLFSTSSPVTPTNPLPQQGFMAPSYDTFTNVDNGKPAITQSVQSQGISDEQWYALRESIEQGYDHPISDRDPASGQQGNSQGTFDHGFNSTYTRYDPTAIPFTPSNGSSVPRGLPLPNTTSSSTPFFKNSGTSNGPEHNLHGPVGQDPSAKPFIFHGSSSAPIGPHLVEATYPESPPSQAHSAAMPAQKRRGRPSKKATATAAQNTGPTSQQLSANLSGTMNKKWVSKKTSKHTDITAVIPAMQSAVRKLRARNDTDPLPDPPNLLPSGLFFSNSNAAALANLVEYWESPRNDQSIPTTQVEVETYIHRFVNAINNNINCVKTNTEKDSKGWVIRWADGATFYRKTAIEALAWKLFQLAMDVHQGGWREAIAEQKIRDDIYYTMDFTFQQRMTLVERVLHFSKSTCDDLLKGNRAHEIIGCPQVVYERIFANQQANQDKRMKLNSIKSFGDIAKESEDDQPTGANTDKTEGVGKQNSKKDISSTTHGENFSGKKSTKTKAGDASNKVPKRKRGDDAEFIDSDSDGYQSQQRFRTSKKARPSIDPVLEELEGGVGFDEPVPADDPNLSYDIEEVESAPPSPSAKKAPEAFAGPSRVLKAATGAASAATKKQHSSVAQPDAEITSGKKCDKRQIDDTDSEDEIPNASKKAKKGGHDLIPANITANPANDLESASQFESDDEEDFTPRPARGRVATKMPKGAQSARKPARSYGGA